MVGPHPPVDLTFHGDQELAADLVDLAVNVRLRTPPAWLADAIRATIPNLGAYPDPTAASAAIAALHGIDPAMVLPTAGGAEAFTLVARAGLGARPLVVHPQFTEPEAALLAAGLRPDRFVLSADSGFTLDPRSVPHDADLVVVGNPTNPTGVLHAADSLRQVIHPGRTLVVDEAFMDAVPDEPESLIGPDLTGVLVLRSLTKTWGLAGLRAGYVIGDPVLVARLRAQQPPWSVSTPALAAMVAVCSRRGSAEARTAAEGYAVDRARLVEGLARLGLSAGRPRTPFVLTRAWAGAREALRTKGFAVRRGDTFPGLGPEWIRIAVRDREVTDAFLAALTEAVAERSAAESPAETPPRSEGAR
ncbi:Rv2231c family pyridoxal phosphate-dependent protein CobC [Granulicoccus sp. GXG6511]|uniref:Rv2231c family pyridoxal phosphate-dependent protein CobC n=1 Tax=Granulicoccus sp. GXG6511 TaxID=3381351 RepID=UPI003D7DA7B1